jgi:hypothetical protein
MVLWSFGSVVLWGYRTWQMLRELLQGFLALAVLELAGTRDADKVLKEQG